MSSLRLFKLELMPESSSRPPSPMKGVVWPYRVSPQPLHGPAEVESGIVAAIPVSCLSLVQDLFEFQRSLALAQAWKITVHDGLGQLVLIRYPVSMFEGGPPGQLAEEGAARGVYRLPLILRNGRPGSRAQSRGSRARTGSWPHSRRAHGHHGRRRLPRRPPGVKGPPARAGRRMVWLLCAKCGHADNPADVLPIQARAPGGSSAIKLIYLQFCGFGSSLE